jgi:hypothetical protein
LKSAKLGAKRQRRPVHLKKLQSSRTKYMERYFSTLRRMLLHRASSALPPHLREIFAEAWLRRLDSPGPAAEHVFQYLRDSGAAAATTAKGADNFYARQYRQYLNAAMGVFAMSATMAALGSGSLPRGRLWSRHRRVAMAMAETRTGAPPIVVLDHQSVAAAVFLPPPVGQEEAQALSSWLAARGPAPHSYRHLANGETIHCAEPRTRAAQRSSFGAMIDLVEAALTSGKLALLVLHPYDPDAMGLHITLFGVEALEASHVEHDYALGAGALDLWRDAAAATGTIVRFLVGGVEEAFTQCSQNLFIKRPRRDLTSGQGTGPRWTPLQPLDRLLGQQFELLQATVSASGLPGVSPRNGEHGLAGFSARRGEKTFTLVPYFIGNAVHGHAAKLWSNPWSSLLVWDDHRSLSAATISGPTRVVEHAAVAKRFPLIAEMLATRRRRNGAAADDPEYWFAQEVTDIRLQKEPLAANWLDPARPPCSLNAGGLAKHGKKPAYFAADSLPPYDMRWQHEREAQGRPADPSGVSRRYWEWDSAEALAARRAHLARLTDVGVGAGKLLGHRRG